MKRMAASLNAELNMDPVVKFAPNVSGKLCADTVVVAMHIQTHPAAITECHMCTILPAVNRVPRPLVAIDTRMYARLREGLVTFPRLRCSPLHATDGGRGGGHTIHFLYSITACVTKVERIA